MRKNWVKLDNAAKVFPPTAHGSHTRVFRLTCELSQPVDPRFLQQALDETAKMFPVYGYILRRGVFWHYLESTELVPCVHAETKSPCAPIYKKGVQALLYEVSYFEHRINLEIYHVLSDGTGATHFLTALVAKYLSLLRGTQAPPLELDASYTQMIDDSFAKYYDKEKRAKPPQAPNAFKIKGPKCPESRLKLISGVVPADKLKAAAKANGASVTQYICACLMRAIYSTVPLRSRKKPITIAVPVNLRNSFPSSSVRNFFTVINVSYQFSSGDGSMADIVKKIKQDFNEGLNPEQLADTINKYAGIERNYLVRVAPLVLKSLVIWAGYALSRRKVTATISNIGMIAMPEELSGIESFYLFSGTDSLQACVCSFKNRLSIGFTSAFTGAEIQREFFRALAAEGIPVEICANPIDEE